MCHKMTKVVLVSKVNKITTNCSKLFHSLDEIYGVSTLLYFFCLCHLVQFNHKLQFISPMR